MVQIFFLTMWKIAVIKHVYLVKIGDTNFSSRYWVIAF